MLSVGPSTALPAPAPLPRYVAAVVLSVLAILSQYYVPALVPASIVLYGNVLSAVLIIYGLPVVVCLALLGSGPLRGAFGKMGVATVRGLSWYGLLSLLALAVVFLLTIAYAVLDPAALTSLAKPNPVLQRAQSDPGFWIAFSFVAGAFEELIFRGFFFGYWLVKSPGRWLTHASWTSALFGAVHLYYGFTYLAVSPIFFVTLFLTGFAFAAAVRDSGGNLVVVALIHGAADATAFLALVNLDLSYALHYGLILFGALVGLVAYLLRRPRTAFPSSPYGLGLPLAAAARPNGPALLPAGPPGPPP